MENKHGITDVIFKVITPLIAVTGIIVGIWQFTQNIKHNDELEFKRRLWEKRLDAYSQLSELIGKLITNYGNSKTFDTLTVEFEQFYWAKLPLIEDKQVETSMIKFQGELRDVKSGDTTFDEFRKRSYLLIGDCKKSLFSSWRDIYHE